MAGWIGVEISRSRVRTPGKAGYGLYRMRGSMAKGQTRIGQGTLYAFEETEWTAYAFTLDAIYLAVQNSIQGGTPVGPASLMVEVAGWRPGDGEPYRTVPTRWTQAYRGRRDLGMPREPEVTEPMTAIAQRSTVRTRQRAANDEFQAEHLKRRAYGLERRHAAKLRRNGTRQNGDMP